MKRRSLFGSLTIGLLLLLTQCTTIPPGSIGIKVNQWGTEKGVMDATECTGYVWYNPMKYDIYEMQTTIQHKEYEGEEGFVVNAKGGAEFHVNPIINYYVRPDQAVDVFKKYKKELRELEQGFIKVAVYDAFRIATNDFTADSLVNNRALFETRVRSILDKELNSNGFIISQFTSNLTYPDVFKKSIESKNAMVQQAQQAENQVKLAEANAKIAIANAEGAAKSLLVQARAESEANRLRQQSLTQLLVQQQLLEKWDGRLPVYGQVPTIFKTITGN